MSAETIPQVLIYQPDLTKSTRPTPTILAPSLESKNDSPITHSKISKHSPNKKNYVTVKKFNSSLATLGSSKNIQKLQPKMQFIQQAALADLPEKNSFAPSSSKNRHRRSTDNLKIAESRQVDFAGNNEADSSMSRLVIDDTNSSSINPSQHDEDTSNNSNIDINFDNVLRKRKSINYSNSYNFLQHNDTNKINIQNKFSRSSSNYNRSPNIIPIPKNFKEIRSVSNRISLVEHSSHDQTIKIQFNSNWGHPKNLLLLSTISVLDESRKSIPINAISSTPDLQQINLLEKLTNNKSPKDENDIINIDYDPSNKEKFSLILSINASANPRYVLIWNPNINLQNKELLSASPKNVTIFLGPNKMAEGEIPQNFGVDLEFKNFEVGELKQSNSSLLIDDPLF